LTELTGRFFRILFLLSKSARFRREMIVASAHGVKTPWKPCGGVLSYQHEFIITHGCSAPLVRRRRVLLWRSRHRRRRPWLGFADMPRRLSRGRVPFERLIAGACGLVADMSTLRSAVLGEQTKPRAHAHNLALPGCRPRNGDPKARHTRPFTAPEQSIAGKRMNLDSAMLFIDKNGNQP
jgi:hypothetical protein